MSDLLGQLYRLQTRILFVREREKKRDTVPPELMEVDREYRDKVGAVAELKPRTPASLDRCEKGWCRVKLGKLNGWVPAAEVWGADPAAQCRTARRTTAPAPSPG